MLVSLRTLLIAAPRRSARHTALTLSAVVLMALVASACQTTPTSVAQQAPDPTVEPSPAVTEAVPTALPSPTPTAMPAAPAATVPPTPTPVPDTDPTPVPLDDLLTLSSLAPVQCPPDVQADQVTCSIATVPLDVTSLQSDQMVQLMVAVVDNGDPNGIGPVIYLGGGPGVESATLAPNFVGAAHDLVFVDQRGTGYSTPKLACPEVDDLWVPQFSAEAETRATAEGVALDNAYQQCHDRLAAAGVDFEHFNTTTSATDIALLQRLLGYDEWSIWGISYGTRLGLTIMRDHPDGVRSAVLDSVVPFEVDFFATIPEHALRSIKALGNACDASTCSDNHGDFFDNLTSLVRQLDAEPVVITATRPGTSTDFPFRVDGEQLISIVFTQLYSTRSLRSLPRQISRANFGGLEEIVANYVARRDPSRFDLSIGLYYSTWCREEFPFYDPSTDDVLLEELEPQFGAGFAEALSSDGVNRFCEIFAVPSADAADDEAMRSDIPTLVFAGAFDPITPPAWSRQVANALPNATYVELADHGHGMATPCPISLRLAFLKNPTAELDSSCADQTGGPDFE